MLRLKQRVAGLRFHSLEAHQALPNVMKISTLVILALCLLPLPASAGPLASEQAKVFSHGGYDSLVAQMDGAGRTRVIVRLDTPYAPLASPDSAVSRRQMGRIARVQNAFLRELASSNLRTLHKYRYVPYVLLDVDRAALDALLASGRVVSVHADLPERPELYRSVPAIGALGLWQSGIGGSGLSVALLDTGVDKDHPFLSGAVVEEACYSTNSATSKSLCPGGVVESAEAGSAVPYGGACPSKACDHGTHVAGVIAGRPDVSGAPGPGVAPESDLVAVQVFSLVDESSVCLPDPAPCVRAYVSDVMKGLERVYELRSAQSIAAVILGVGGVTAASCDDDPRKMIIDGLKAAGVATIAPSGNSGLCGAVTAPACISSVVSVGAVTDADMPAPYSNRSAGLNLLAPGSVTSSVPGGLYQTGDGTSMSAAHVAGAWALLKQAAPGKGVDQILAALSSTGLSVKDVSCRESKAKRIDLSRAVAALTTPSSTSGGLRSFAAAAITPQAAPTATTDPATAIGQSFATLNGTVDDQGADTTVTFEYGLTTSYEIGPVTADQSPILSGSGLTTVSAGLAGLQPNTLYHYRVKAQNSSGTTYGLDSSFTTSVCNMGQLLDGGFEAGLGPANTNWEQTSTNWGYDLTPTPAPLGTPLCTFDYCGNGDGTVGPRTGSVWTWFGTNGAIDPETASLSQFVVFHTGTFPKLGLYLRTYTPSGNGTDSFGISVDGTERVTILESNATYVQPTYVSLQLDLSPYADGLCHKIKLHSTTLATATGFLVDDVSLSCGLGETRTGASAPYTPPSPFATLTAAFAAAADGTTIRANTAVFAGDLSVAGTGPGNAALTLIGGYNCDFTSKVGSTTAQGLVTVGAFRSLTVDGLVIR